jgi:SAM-dependent methyltransferase
MPTAQVKILSPRSQLSFVSGWYELASDSHFWMAGRLAATLRQFRNNRIQLDRASRGLEIGCGQGVLRAQLERHSLWTIDGCDLDLASLKNNPAGRGEVFLYDIFERADFLQKKYDFIVLFDVIEHIEDVQAFMAASLFHLKDGGFVFINVPALNSLYSAYDKVVGHLRRYDKPMMTEELTKCDLDVVHLNYWGLSFLPVLQLRKMMLRRAAEETVVQKGFRPPGAITNALLKGMIRLEASLVPDPIRGTSLMAIARKRAA